MTIGHRIANRNKPPSSKEKEVPEQASPRDRTVTSNDEETSRRAVGTARLLPVVAFGLGTAVLAGVIVGAAPAPDASAHVTSVRVAATVALGGAISELTGASDTTCCVSQPPSRSDPAE
jgi:hypothetical protein